MPKHLILLLLLTLFFNACAERGYTPKPFSNTSISMSHPIVKNKKHKTEPIVIITSKKETFNKVKHIVQKSKINDTKAISQTEIKIDKPKEDSLFTLSDETKNKISGLFIIIIGMIILL